MKKLFLTWAQFDAAAKQIAEHYKDAGLTRIVGISRGGLPLAVKLSNLLNIPMTPLVWQTRDGDIKDGCGLLDLRGETDTILFVDDICDTGETIKQIKKITPGTRWCTWITKEQGLTEYQVTSLRPDDERWIVFPWE